MPPRTHERSANGTGRHSATAPAPAPIALAIDPEALRPLIAAVVAEALAQLGQAQAALPDGEVFTEQEAARFLKLNEHQLRDERLRRRIRASAIVGRRVRYRRADLLTYLTEREWKPPER